MAPANARLRTERYVAVDANSAARSYPHRVWDQENGGYVAGCSSEVDAMREANRLNAEEREAAP